MGFVDVVYVIIFYLFHISSPHMLLGLAIKNEGNMFFLLMFIMHWYFISWRS